MYGGGETSVGLYRAPGPPGRAGGDKAPGSKEGRQGRIKVPQVQGLPGLPAAGASTAACTAALAAAGAGGCCGSRGVSAWPVGSSAASLALSDGRGRCSADEGSLVSRAARSSADSGLGVPLPLCCTEAPD